MRIARHGSAAIPRSGRARTSAGKGSYQQPSPALAGRLRTIPPFPCRFTMCRQSCPSIVQRRKARMRIARQGSAAIPPSGRARTTAGKGLDQQSSPALAGRLRIIPRFTAASQCAGNPCRPSPQCGTSPAGARPCPRRFSPGARFPSAPSCPAGSSS